jgi:hypothetical protein
LTVDDFSHGDMASASRLGNQFLRKGLRGVRVGYGAHV